MKILLAVDGSDYTISGVDFLIAHFSWFKDAPELHLLHYHNQMTLHHHHIRLYIHNYFSMF